MHRSLRTGFFPALHTLLGVLLLAGCAIQSPELPVIGTPGTSLPGKVVWHDLVTPDLQKSKHFYAGLFGWQFEELTDGYVLARNAGRPVADLAGLDAGQRTSHWLPLVSVTDIVQAEETTRASGGEVVLKALELRGRGRVAVLKDPQGGEK